MTELDLMFIAVHLTGIAVGAWGVWWLHPRWCRRPRIPEGWRGP